LSGNPLYYGPLGQRQGTLGSGGESVISDHGGRKEGAERGSNLAEQGTVGGSPAVPAEASYGKSTGLVFVANRELELARTDVCRIPDVVPVQWQIRASTQTRGAPIV